MSKKIFFPILLLAVVYLTACSSEKKQDAAKQEKASQQELSQSQAADAEMAVDPVCGMKVKKSEAEYTFEKDGKTYYFCMKADYDTFAANPEKYIKADKS